MNTCAFLLILAVHIHADGIEGPTAGCTFDEGSDPSLCEYSQGDDDDFDWQLFRSQGTSHASTDLIRGSYLMVNSSQHAPAATGHSPGALRVYVRVNGGVLGLPVWNVSGSHGHQWHQVELAVSMFWPNEYQILLEAIVSKERHGYIAIDDIMILNYPCYKAPHFSRLGDMEVNVGQNASFQCVASGRPSETETFLLERHNGKVTTSTSVKHLNYRRFVASFQLDNVQKPEQDLYRCVALSPRGAGVSNFAELLVKVPPSPIAPPQLLRAGSTYLIIQLNTNSILGDGPIIRREIEFRASHLPFSEINGVNMVTYKLWHLDPDTEYQVSVMLTRPGEGGTGPPGPPLISRTKCAGEWSSESYCISPRRSSCNTLCSFRTV
ncbi:hypothetical protein AALO_G00179940 [Alosa alosa]|uniref:Uncharacterized protein n=1 Tax=Alosa alosa TaxID=278164 RepID=A0AAV6G8U2_9TELE|nr:hypothetical protein AALO_G00179940 [Alosa alosa]